MALGSSPFRYLPPRVDDLWELSRRSLFYHISFPSTFICIFYFPIYIIKIQKYLSYHIISIISHFRKWSWRDRQPLYRIGCEVLVCLCRCNGLLRSLLLDWYLGSQKLRKILTLLYNIILSSSRENQRSAQEVARRISGAVAGEIRTKSSQDLLSRQRAISGTVVGESTQKSTYQVPLTNSYLQHYIICYWPLDFLSPTSPFPFYSPSLSQSSPLSLSLVFLCAYLSLWLCLRTLIFILEGWKRLN